MRIDTQLERCQYADSNGVISQYRLRLQNALEARVYLLMRLYDSALNASWAP